VPRFQTTISLSASPDELTQAIAYALQVDGRKRFRVSGEIMAKITAAHLAECLRQAGYLSDEAAGAAAARRLTHQLSGAFQTNTRI